jgi:glycosyltransferase involved in cell wall biosynthesis
MSEPLPLSLIVITRDAAHELAECLASAPFAAEALVVDSGSSDDTVALARRCGARVIEHAWQGFGPQKAFAVAQACHDWVLCIDADERVSPDLAAAITALLAAGAPPVGAYAVARRNRFLGRWLEHGEGYPDWNVRLFDRRRARWSADPVHEHVVADGPVARLPGDLLHASAESLAAYIAKQNRYTTLQADKLVAAGKHVSAVTMLLSPLVRFLKFYLFRLGFLDGVPGLVHIAIGCWNSFVKYAKAWVSQRPGG